MYTQREPETIKKCFSSIAKHYDRTNGLLSLGLYKKWNTTLVQKIGPKATLLDLCAGTGDISFAFLKKNPESKAILLDFCPEMLQVATQKGKHIADRFQTIVADAQNIPIPNESVEGITIAYGIRNVKSPRKVMEECFRLLKPHGVLGILELTRPSHPFFYWGHTLYLKNMLPLLGKWGGKNKEAYTYLAKSISHFSSPVELEKNLLQVGFREVKKIPLMMGSATILIASKN